MRRNTCRHNQAGLTEISHDLADQRRHRKYIHRDIRYPGVALWTEKTCYNTDCN